MKEEVRRPRQTKQGELFQATTTWVHVLHAMIEDGDCAAMRPFAFAVYVVIKSHASFRDGTAFPSIDTIAAKTGISRRQVISSLRTLENAGYLAVERRGRRNHYRLREKVAIRGPDGAPTALASWDYRPSAMKDALDQLKAMLATGRFDPPTGGNVLIRQLNMNVQLNLGPGIQIIGPVPEDPT